jgi:hypothetical protein
VSGRAEIRGYDPGCSVGGVSGVWVAVEEQDALAAAGAVSRVWRASPVTYALGPAALVMVIDAGDRPDGSAVYATDQVILRPPIPEDALAVLTGGPQGLPILGFARVPEGYLALGRLRVTSHSSAWAAGTPQPRFQDCHVNIQDPLPFPALDRVRPVSSTPLPGVDWADLLPGDPIGALRGFLTAWFADVPAGTTAAPDGSSRGLPRALAALYETAAGRREPLGGFNRIFTPNQFQVADDGRVVFGIECEGVWKVMMDPAESDPAVVYDDLGAGPVAERERLAGFLMQFSVCDAAIGSPYGAWGFAHEEGLRQLVGAAGLRPIPLAPLRWPADPTHLYVGAGVAVAAARMEPDAFQIYAGARQRAALLPMRDASFEWEHFTG